MRIDINQLRRSGVMPRDLNGASAGTLSVKYPPIDFAQEITFVSRRRHYGGRQFFFQCPATGRLCSVLWRPPGAKQFACRQAWRNVAYSSQFADATSRCHLTKMKIQRRLSDKEWADLLPPRPKRMRRKTYERWQERFDRQDEKLDAMLQQLFRTKWAVLKGLV